MVRSGGSRIAFVFPGQASQKAGMAAELLDGESAARAVFERASQVLGLDLADICVRADDHLLSRTDVTQPALLTTCVAWLSVLRERGVLPQMVAGHSLGEFSAWVATEALDFESAVRLVRRRGEIMEDAAERNPGGMSAVIGLADRQVVEMCAEAGRSAVVVLAKRAGGRTISLRVSGAFHSPLMEDAARAFAALVAEAPVQDPKAPVVANATAEPVSDAAGVREAMTKQMTSPVLWTASVRRLIEDGASLFVEVGPGAVLTNLTARISADARAVAVGTPEQLQELLEEVKP